MQRGCVFPRCIVESSRPHHSFVADARQRLARQLPVTGHTVSLPREHKVIYTTAQEFYFSEVLRRSEGRLLTIGE